MFMHNSYYLNALNIRDKQFLKPIYTRNEFWVLNSLLILSQSELPQPVPRNSMESDHGCTLRIYFDNAGDNLDADVIYQRHRNDVNTITSVNEAKQMAINDVYVFFNKISI